jgi:hypothetical protein
MMEAARTSETSVDNHFTRQYNPEDSSEQVLHCLKNIPYFEIFRKEKNVNFTVLIVDFENVVPLLQDAELHMQTTIFVSF